MLLSSLWYFRNRNNMYKLQNNWIDIFDGPLIQRHFKSYYMKAGQNIQQTLATRPCSGISLQRKTEKRSKLLKISWLYGANSKTGPLNMASYSFFEKPCFQFCWIPSCKEVLMLKSTLFKVNGLQVSHTLNHKFAFVKMHFR